MKAVLKTMPSPVAKNIVELDYVRLKWPGFKQWALREFERATEGINPEVVLVHKPIDLYFIKKILPNAKIVAVVHSFTAKHLENADRVFAVSKALKQYIEEQGCKVPVSVINNAIEISDPPSPQVERAVPVIGTMAVFRRTKRLDLLIKSLSQLKQQGISFRGVVAGAGIQKIYLSYLIKKYKLNGQVELRSWVEDKDAFFSEIDIFCISSKRETFSISLIEAMARKKAVVATACGGPNEIIDHQVDGLLSPVGDVSAYTDKLAKLVGNPSERAVMAQAAYDKVKNCYSSEVIRAKLQQQLEQLTSTPSH